MIFNRKTTTEILIGTLRETLSHERILHEDRLFRRHPPIRSQQIGIGFNVDVPSAERKALLLQGYIVWAYVVEAPPELYEKGQEDRWISVVYSSDQTLDGRLSVLEQAASRLVTPAEEAGENLDLKTFSPFDSEQEPLEGFQPQTLPIPDLSGDRQIFYSQLRASRKMLPRKRLAMPWFPIFAPPETTAGCRLISSTYWPWELKVLWRSLG